MGYGYYVIDGMERGYSVEDICNKEGCEVEIDRGLAYLCGQSPYQDSDNCARYFCASHLVYTAQGQRCHECAALIPEDEDFALLDVVDGP